MRCYWGANSFGGASFPPTLHCLLVSSCPHPSHRLTCPSLPPGLTLTLTLSPLSLHPAHRLHGWLLARTRSKDVTTSSPPQSILTLVGGAHIGDAGAPHGVGHVVVAGVHGLASKQVGRQAVLGLRPVVHLGRLLRAQGGEAPRTEVAGSTRLHPPSPPNPWQTEQEGRACVQQHSLTTSACAKTQSSAAAAPGSAGVRAASMAALSLCSSRLQGCGVEQHEEGIPTPHTCTPHRET